MSYDMSNPFKRSEAFQELYEKVEPMVYKAYKTPKGTPRGAKPKNAILNTFLDNREMAGKSRKIGKKDNDILNSGDIAKMEKWFKDSFKMIETSKAKKEERAATGKKTLADLKEEARKKGIVGFSKMDKADLTKALAEGSGAKRRVVPITEIPSQQLSVLVKKVKTENVPMIDTKTGRVFLEKQQVEKMVKKGVPNPAFKEHQKKLAKARKDTIASLKAEAREKKIKGFSKMNKAQLLKALGK